MSNTVRIKIEGMSCGHCSGAVEKALAAVNGVERVVEVSLESGIATVEGTASPQALAAAVVEAGYSVIEQ